MTAILDRDDALQTSLPNTSPKPQHHHIKRKPPIAPRHNIIGNENGKQAAYKFMRDQILALAKDACKKLGGQAIIGEGFLIVDTSKYNVTAKDEIQS